MLRGAIILALIWCTYLNGVAQVSFTVRGVVLDTAGEALSKATIVLANKKDSVIAISREDGSFIFSNQNTRYIRLTISMKGYVTTYRNISVKQGVNHVELDPILLSLNYTQLDSVIVKQIRPNIIIGMDTISYNAAAFKVRDGSEVEGLLKRLPGIEVDMSGNVIIQGKRVARVRVDGNDFFGGDVLTAIRNLPADIVDKLQIIDDYGDKARLTGIKSGESTKILNIVLKSDKRTGQFGRVQTSGGNANKYGGEAFANLFKDERQFSINGSFDNMSPSGNTYSSDIQVHYANRWKKQWFEETNMSFSSATPSVSGSSVQDNYYASGHLHLEQNNHTSSFQRAGTFSSNTVYSPDNYRTLRIQSSLSYQQSGQTSSSLLSSIQQENGFFKTTSGNTSSDLKNSGKGAQMEIYYEQLSHHSRNRFNVQANAQYSGSQTEADNLSNTFTQTSAFAGHSTVHYLVNSAGRNLRTTVAANYFFYLGRLSIIEFGYSWNRSYVQNNMLTWQPDSISNRLIKVDSLSDIYFLQSIAQHLHIGYSAQIKKLAITLTMEAQPISIRGITEGKVMQTNYHYFGLFPRAQANWNFAAGKSLSFQYTGNPELPSLQQLQPLTDQTNPQYPVTGNPSLKPAFMQNISVTYEHGELKPTRFHGFGLGVGYNAFLHAIIPNITHIQDTGSIIQKTTYLNAGQNGSYYTTYHLNLPSFFKNRLRVVVNGNISFSQTDAMTDNTLYTTHTQVWTNGLHLQYIISNTFESDLTANYGVTRTNYQSNNPSNVSFSTADWALNNKQVLWKKWILNYNISQAFNSSAIGKLLARPIYITASIQRQFLTRNRFTVGLTGYDLLNNSLGFMQSLSPTNITKSQTNIIGRYILVSFVWKWGKFGE